MAADANWSHQESQKATRAGGATSLGPHTPQWQALADCWLGLPGGLLVYSFTENWLSPSKKGVQRTKKEVATLFMTNLGEVKQCLVVWLSRLVDNHFSVNCHLQGYIGGRKVNVHRPFVYVKVRRHPQMSMLIGLQVLCTFDLRQSLSGWEHYHPEQANQPVSFQTTLPLCSILP